ncbi:MAG: c-type cytochrome biogenesis protein CcsB [Candidatus Abyssubacteria bacterium]
MWLGAVQLIYFAAAVTFFSATISKRALLGGLARILALAGVLVHLAAIIHRGLIAERLPLTNTYETLVLFSLLLMVSFMLADRRYQLPALGGFAGLAAAVTLSACSLISSDIEPLLPSLRSNWLLFHVLSSFLGYAAFALAFGTAVAYFVIDLRLPPLQRLALDHQEIKNFLDWFTYRSIAFGFPLLTLGIVMGAIWANTCWGRYWNWDPKESWSFITWFVYASCLHMRFGGMRGKASAAMAVIGFGCVIFTYLGVNYWLAGLHDYA